MTRWLTGGPAVVNGGPPPLTGGQSVVNGGLPSLTTVDRWNEVQTDMSADMSVRGTRWQDTSVRGTVQVAAEPIKA
ncbi:hypothetical protein Tco_1476167 [Tanacetum coccineum]